MIIDRHQGPIRKTTPYPKTVRKVVRLFVEVADQP